jgi:hypothetical protein
MWRCGCVSQPVADRTSCPPIPAGLRPVVHRLFMRGPQKIEAGFLGNRTIFTIHSSVWTFWTTPRYNPLWVDTIDSCSNKSFQWLYRVVIIKFKKIISMQTGRKVQDFWINTIKPIEYVNLLTTCWWRKSQKIAILGGWSSIKSVCGVQTPASRGGYKSSPTPSADRSRSSKLDTTKPMLRVAQLRHYFERSHQFPG